MIIFAFIIALIASYPLIVILLGLLRFPAQCPTDGRERRHA